MSTSDKDNIKTYADPGGKLLLHGAGQETSDEQKARENADQARKDAAARAAAAANRPPDTAQFDTRRQDYADLASAFGVSRTGSDADLLGFVGSRKKVGAARRILGS